MGDNILTKIYILYRFTLKKGGLDRNYYEDKRRLVMDEDMLCLTIFLIIFLIFTRFIFRRLSDSFKKTMIIISTILVIVIFLFLRINKGILKSLIVPGLYFETFALYLMCTCKKSATELKKEYDDWKGIFFFSNIMTFIGGIIFY